MILYAFRNHSISQFFTSKSGARIFFLYASPYNSLLSIEIDEGPRRISRPPLLADEPVMAEELSLDDRKIEGDSFTASADKEGLEAEVEFF